MGIKLTTLTLSSVLVIINQCNLSFQAWQLVSWYMPKKIIRLLELDNLNNKNWNNVMNCECECECATNTHVVVHGRNKIGVFTFTWMTLILFWQLLHVHFVIKFKKSLFKNQTFKYWWGLKDLYP